MNFFLKNLLTLFIKYYILISVTVTIIDKELSMTLKYSKQREAIKSFLMTRKDHPTADVVYSHVREEFPNISLGTVYRNLTLLSDLGEILRIRVGDGIDHFDATVDPHYHFICTECGSVIDLDLSTLTQINEIADASFDGKIAGHVTYFYGTCPNCMKDKKTLNKKKLS